MVDFVTYQLDTDNNIVTGTQLDCTGIVSSNTITGITVIDGTDLGNSVNDVVEMVPTANWGQGLSDALTNQHSREGVHEGITNTGGLTTDTLTVTSSTSLPAGAIRTDDLANSGVTAPKISTSAISLGKTLLTSNIGASGSASAAPIAGLGVTVTIPSGGRDVEISAFLPNAIASGAINMFISIWDGAVGSGTQLTESGFTFGGGSFVAFFYASAIVTPSIGSKTYNVGYRVTAGSFTSNLTPTIPAYILVKAI